MYTVIDYLNYYKNISLSDVHWNNMDNLVCSILVYLNIESFKEEKNISELYDYYLKFKNKATNSLMAPKAFDMLSIILSSKRYKELTVSNFNVLLNNKTQFGAATFKIKNILVVSFRGTDGSFIGWVENFRIAYEYPTYTQNLAIDYLNNIDNYDQKNIYVVGHSKGGNLAMVSSMEANDEVFDRIKKVCNFDGPGFRKDEYNSQKYNRLSKKLYNVVPTGSIVGVLLNNKKYEVIKSNEIAFDEHYPTSWNVFGEYFVKGTSSKVSMQLHENTTTGLAKLDQEKVKEIFETLFKSMGGNYSDGFKISLSDLRSIFNNMKNVDLSTLNYINKIINTLVNVSRVGDKEE